MPTATAPLSVISSMATRGLLAELLARHEAASGQPAVLTAIGGVDAERRVAEGQAFDLVVLADDALARLEAEGHLRPGSMQPLVRSEVALAVRAGAPHPDIASAAALRAALQAAPSLGYSTGPSGKKLLAMLQGWGLAEALAPRLRQAQPGVPVATLVAAGEVALGLQQLSEMMHAPGIEVVGTLPAEAALATIFGAAVAARSAQPQAAAELRRFLASAAAADCKRQHGMAPV